MDTKPNIPGGEIPEQIKKVRIYTMPEKFYIEDKKGGGGKNTFLIFGIIILAVLVLGGGAYFVLTKYNQPNANANSALANANEEGNANANSNNANKNANANLNANNANSQSNRNVSVENINLFANANTAPLNVNKPVASGQDSDSDGLTDTEEALFGTSVSFPDTDSDGYADGQELTGGYDPNSTGKLENSSKIRVYDDASAGYTIFYPAAWVADDDPQNPGGKIFTSGDEFVSLSIQDNPSLLSARDWYLSKSPGVETSQLTSVANWDKSLSGVKSADGLTVYYTKGTKAYVINYNTNILTEANYLSTFTMMYKSFKLVAPTTNSNANANLNGNNNSNTNGALNQNANANGNANHNANSNQNANANVNANINANSNANSLSNRL